MKPRALINRATQGLYPPGSTFKIVTLASALENLPDLNDFAFDCTGYYPVGNYAVTDGSAHGVQTLSDAFARSCNTTFAALSQDLGGGWVTYGVGAQIMLGDSAYFYGELERTSGGDIDNPYLFSAGVRMTF